MQHKINLENYKILPEDSNETVTAGMVQDSDIPKHNNLKYRNQYIFGW